LFAFISLFTAVGEEFLYRGFLTDNLLGLWGAPVLAVAASSALYGFNHIPFGLPAFLGKFVAGCLFASLALLGSGSIVACLVAHLLLQVLVFRRLRK
jgi:membrane protease YdiL (CAAX protease family)